MGELMSLAVYNPAILSDKDFLAGFVACQELADNLTARLRDITPSGLARHQLILGQRGMGKTTLLRRLALAVRDDPDLSAKLLPLTFREEQYNVHNLRTLWLNCLDALADWLERNGRSERAAALDAEIAALDRDARDPDGVEVLEAFRAACRTESRRPLILLDSIDLILNGLADQDWSLRRVLQEAGGMVVVGATAGYLEATADPKGAFYDFFQVTVLERLSQDEMLACLRCFAEGRGAGGERVRRVVAEDPGRIRTLYDLTGGNPRTLVLLYLLLELDAEGDVMSDLERLLDQVTVLYKARVEDLAPQARVVLDALALHWDPATAADLAAASGLGTAAVSTQLDRLQRQGLVEKVAVSTSARAAFQLVERFFNIWYLMRHGPRRQRTRLRWLTGFLRGFYTPQQLHDRGRALLLRPDAGDGLDYEYRVALGEVVAEPDLRYLLNQSARVGMERLAAAHGKRLEDLMDPAELPEPETANEWYNVGWWLHMELDRYAEAEDAYRRAIDIDPDLVPVWFNLGNLLEGPLGDPDKAETAYRKALELNPDDLKLAYSLVFLVLTQPSCQPEAEARYQSLLPRLPPYAAGMLTAVYGLALGDFGGATRALRAALNTGHPTLFSPTNMNLPRILRLAAQRGQGEALLAWLDAEGLSDRYWPVRAAFDAYLHADARLMDVNPEVRGAAKRIYDWLDAPRRHAATAAPVAPKPLSRERRRG